MTDRSRLCTRCHTPTREPRKDGRPILCAACRLTTERERSRRRVWYRGRWNRISRELRAVYPCQECGATTHLQVDHRTPRSLTGGLRVLCGDCHRRIGEHA